MPAALFMVFLLDSKGAKSVYAEKTQHPKTKHPDVRCEVFDPKDGLKIRYTECNLTMAYGRWSRHADEKHNANNSQDQVDDGNVEAENRPCLLYTSDAADE